MADSWHCGIACRWLLPQLALATECQLGRCKIGGGGRIAAVALQLAICIHTCVGAQAYDGLVCHSRLPLEMVYSSDV